MDSADRIQSASGGMGTGRAIRRRPTMRRPAIAVILLALVALAAILVDGSLTGASPGSTERASVDSAGNGGNDLSRSAAISADGPYVALQSRASNLVVGDTTLAPPSGATPFALVTGWNHVCYIGVEQPIEDALAPFLADVAAVYRLRSDQGYDRWFPRRSEVSTITTVSPYKPLLILVTDGATWYQTPSDGPPAGASLLPGWNSVCYTEATKPPDDATSGIAEDLTILYRLETTKTWSRHVPSRPEVSNIAQLEQYDAVLMLVTEWGGGIWPEFAVSTGSDKRSDPAISGNIVVWNEKRGQDWDIRGYDLSRQTEFAIATQEENQRYPAISGNVIVWQDERTTLPRIYGYDLATKQEFPVTAEESPQFYPDISGNIVVFRDWRNKTGGCAWGGTPGWTSYYCDWDIWGADLGSGAEFPIRTEPNVQRPPRISGKTVVWAERPEGGGSAIYIYQVGSGGPSQIAGSPDYGPPKPMIDGNIVVWDWGEIVGYDLLTGGEFLVTTGPHSIYEPDISGNIVVWADNRHADSDIYGYDLASGKEFPISTAPGDQVEPAIHGDVVVWVDERNSYTEIYGVRLPSTNEQQTEHVVPAPIPTPMATWPPPILLSPVGGATVDPNDVLYRWTPVEGARLYELGLGHCPDRFFWHAPRLRRIEHVFVWPLEPGETYCWGVRALYGDSAFDDDAWSEWAEATFHTSP